MMPPLFLTGCRQRFPRHDMSRSIAVAAGSSEPMSARNRPGPSRGTSIGSARSSRYVMKSCTVSQIASPVHAHPSAATARSSPGAGRRQQRMPTTRHTAPPAASTRPFSPMTPRSGWSPANRVSQGRNAPIVISAPPATAAEATRRSRVDGGLAIATGSRCWAERRRRGRRWSGCPR